MYRVTPRKSLSQQQGQLTLSSVPAAVPCCKFPLWDSFAEHHFTALVLEEVPNLQPLQQ